MKIENFVSKLIENVNNRFDIDYSANLNTLLNLGKELPKKKLIRIQRKFNDNRRRLETWKTLLIVELEDRKSLKNVLQWAALVKDSLLDPETADLYLFILFENYNINIEDSIRIELTEQFCRKYVQRPSETIEQLIARTFLHQIEDSSKKTLIKDPLNQALHLTHDKFTWFTAKEQKKWKSAFLSEVSGIELIEKLITENEEQI